jgi:2-haloacid dehalogenase
MRPVLRLLAAALGALVAMASTAIEQPSASVERGGPRRYAAVAFDYLVLFNPDSVVSVVDQIAPGLTPLFDALISTDVNHTYKPDPRAYQLGVDHLRLAKQDIVFAAFGGWDAAGAKSFGYPTVWVNRFNQPAEELGVRPDRSVTDLKGLLDFVLTVAPGRTPVEQPWP